MKATVYRCEWINKKQAIAGFEIREVELYDSNLLEELQKLVGGLIELIQTKEHGDLIINEEGLLFDLPLNKWASENWMNLCGTVVKLHDKLPEED